MIRMIEVIETACDGHRQSEVLIGIPAEERGSIRVDAASGEVTHREPSTQQPHLRQQLVTQ
jgi:hypothetical protein